MFSSLDTSSKFPCSQSICSEFIKSWKNPVGSIKLLGRALGGEEQQSNASTAELLAATEEAKYLNSAHASVVKDIFFYFLLRIA